MTGFDAQALPQPESVIRSAANPRYRALRVLLQDGRERKRTGRAVLEGDHLVAAWLARGGTLLQWAFAEGETERYLTLSARAAAGGQAASGAAPVSARERLPPLWLTPRLMAQASSLPSAPPVIAVVDPERPRLPAHLDSDLVILDRIQDPANVGAMLRTAAAAGIARVVTTPGTAECWSPKALRAGMSGQFALAIHEGVALPDLVTRLRVPLVATVIVGGTALNDCDLRPPLAWWFGHEGAGIAAEALPRASLCLRIDQSVAVESLNVAAAAAICLFEQRRQRLSAHRDA